MGDKFVGRCELMNELKDEWKRKRIFGISGPMSVGKTRYVKEFLRDLKTSDGNDTRRYKIVAVDFKSVKTLEDYLKTIASCLNIWTQDANAIVQSLKSSGHVYIFHHDHQEYARLKSSTGEELTQTSQDSLWDTIYDSVVKKLLEDNDNFYLIISSTDEFRFAEFRRLFWSQNLLELTEDESLELLHEVWTSRSEEKDRESSGHIVRLCNGVPSAIINTGLLLNEEAFSVQEVIVLLLQHIIDFLSDEVLPNSEKIRKQLLRRWNHLRKDQMDNLMKSLIIINNTRSISVDALAKLHQENPSVAEFKLFNLLPLRRRNLLSVNKKDNSVKPCPLIQHMLKAVYYIDKDALQEEISVQISALLEQQAKNASLTADVRRTPGKDGRECAPAKSCRLSSWDGDNTAMANQQWPMEGIELESSHSEQSLNLSNDENQFQVLVNTSGFQKSRQNSFIGQNLDNDFSEKGNVYGDKGMCSSGNYSKLKHNSATERKESNLEHSAGLIQDNGANLDNKLDMSKYKYGPEISISGEFSSSNEKLPQCPGNHTSNCEPDIDTNSLNQSVSSLSHGIGPYKDNTQHLVTVSGLKSLETNGSECIYIRDADDVADHLQNGDHMSQTSKRSPKKELDETAMETSAEPETNIPGLSQLDVTLSGESGHFIPVQNLHLAQSSPEGLNVQSTNEHSLNQPGTSSSTTRNVEAESNDCSNDKFLIQNKSFPCDNGHCPRVANQNADRVTTQPMSSADSESTSGSIGNESRVIERTNSDVDVANETTRSLSSSILRVLMNGIVEVYKSAE